MITTLVVKIVVKLVAVLGVKMVVLVVVVMLIIKIAQVKLEDWAGFPLTTLSIWNKYKDVRSLINIPL